MEGTVADEVERKKRSKYASAGWTAAEDGRLWAFGLTSQGQLGQEAESFIDRVAKAARKSGRQFSRRWWEAAFACVALRWAPQVKDEWCERVTTRAILEASRAVGPRCSASVTGPHAWDDSEVGRGLVGARLTSE
jgi:hypothetical protein